MSSRFSCCCSGRSERRCVNVWFGVRGRKPAAARPRSIRPWPARRAHVRLRGPRGILSPLNFRARIAVGEGKRKMPHSVSTIHGAHGGCRNGGSSEQGGIVDAARGLPACTPRRPALIEKASDRAFERRRKLAHMLPGLIPFVMLAVYHEDPLPLRNLAVVVGVVSVLIWIWYRRRAAIARFGSRPTTRRATSARPRTSAGRTNAALVQLTGTPPRI